MADCTPCAFSCGKTTHNSECFQVPTNLTARSFQGNALFLLHVLQCRRPMSFTSLAARFLKFAGSRPSLSLQQRHIQNLNDGTRVQHPDMACEGMPSLVHILTLPAPSRRPGDRLAVPGANATGGGVLSYPYVPVDASCCLGGRLCVESQRSTPKTRRRHRGCCARATPSA
jgi:hypothetical protein